MILAGLDTGGIVPFPAAPRRLRRMSLRVLLRSVALATAALALTWAAHAQNPPAGQPVLNQGISARALTASDSVKITVTRGIYIGDASPCTAAVLFNGDTASVTMTNLQSGATYPFSVIQLLSTGTTCASVFGLY